MLFTELLDTPRERFYKNGVEALSDAELINLISGISNIEKCVEIANNIYNSVIVENQLTTKQYTSIISAIELGKRILTKHKEVYTISSPDAVAEYLMPRYNNKKVEIFGVLLLDIKNNLIAKKEITQGSLSASVVHPREVLKEAISHSAASMILYHNHPSGDPTPSQEDIKTTDRLVKVGKLMDIPILDHLILGYNRYTSLKERGFM